MKKARNSRSREPTAATLRELPAVDFERYRVRRNRFARRVAREGIAVAHESPSRSSLEEIPEADFDRTTVRSNPYAKRVAAGALILQEGRGRPRRDAEVGPTVTRSVRLPPAAWDELERRARREGTTVHALVRRAIAELLERVA
ncbi:MAG: ribbon-helix-helix protein, CopG family [Deltaproteobacteria bacterium]|nr:ribbon-helix-helix protein, CopG family [Deltaproteobacteria bacterium]